MNQTWWKEGIIYQIYPRSFMDSNGDGIGDLQGILRKLDYIKDLGVDIIWLNPIYQSPNDDNGYDISDYYSIHPEYGTMQEFDTLLAALHDRGLKLIMDIVINHTSDEHPWFLQSKQDRDNPFADYYFWRSGRNGGPPNNWPSFFGGPAWTYEPSRDQYYLHLFSKKQPDLNWEHVPVRAEVDKILTFWLDKGIDGFRLDVIPLISKRLNFPDADLSDFGRVIEEVYSNGPRVHEYLKDIGSRIFSKYDILTVGEGPGINQEHALLYVGQDRQELDMIFQLDHMALDHGPGGRFDRSTFTLPDLKLLLHGWDQAVGQRGWQSFFLDNHDFPRMLSRFGNDNTYRAASAQLLCMLILSQRGTPCIYFGSEVGMTNVAFDRIEDYRDVEAHNFYALHKADGGSEAEFLDLLHTQGRDNVRTPMQWSPDRHAGFTTGEPWIRVNDNHTSINVQADLASSQSIYRFYQEMIALRKAHPTLVYGETKLLVPDHPQLYAYERFDDDARFLILLNFSDGEVRYDLGGQWRKILGNYAGDASALRPWEAVLLRAA